jgi:hypothetical protein
MEHAIHLAARHFIEGINPTPIAVLRHRKTLRQKQLGTAILSDDEDYVFEDKNMQVNDEETIEDLDDEQIGAVDFEPGDVVGKALGFVTQVRKSSDARAYLRSLCEKEDGVPAIELATWVRTRWASLYHFFGVMLQLRPVSLSF